MRPIVSVPSQDEQWALDFVVLRGEVTENDVMDWAWERRFPYNTNWTPAMERTVMRTVTRVLSTMFPPERWEEFQAVVPGGVVRAWKLRK